jgi:hypothetical protein
MKGWEPIPSALIGDTRLSLQTRAVYMLLRNLIWQETRASEDTMTAEVGTVAEIAAAAGCSANSMKTYLAELRDAGWVSTSRMRRGHPFTITVFSIPTEPDFGSVALTEAVPTEPDSGPVQSQILAHSRGRVPSGSSNKSQTEEANASSDESSIADFLDEKFGVAPPDTNAGRKRLKAIADLRALGATADSLRHAFGAADYGDRRWAMKTDIALATHYPTLTRGYQAPNAQRGVVVPLMPGETSEQAYRRWVAEKASAPDYALFEIFLVIGDWRDIDDVARDELRTFAERTREDVTGAAVSDEVAAA